MSNLKNKIFGYILYLAPIPLFWFIPWYWIIIYYNILLAYASHKLHPHQIHKLIVKIGINSENKKI